MQEYIYNKDNSMTEKKKKQKDLIICLLSSEELYWFLKRCQVSFPIPSMSNAQNSQRCYILSVRLGIKSINNHICYDSLYSNVTIVQMPFIIWPFLCLYPQVELNKIIKLYFFNLLYILDNGKCILFFSIVSILQCVYTALIVREK